MIVAIGKNWSNKNCLLTEQTILYCTLQKSDFC